MRLQHIQTIYKALDIIHLLLGAKCVDVFVFIVVVTVSIVSGLGFSDSYDKNCSTEQFTCRSGKGECVAMNWMCDENPDCADGSDEADCNSTCRPDEFTCDNKHCIQKRWLCDYDNDCGDKSDEENCKMTACNTVNDFSCTKNLCIMSRWQCDGDFDCPNHFDEMICPSFNAQNIMIPQCLHYEFDCGDWLTCIHRSWLCDGDKDCPNGGDETTDKCSTVTCQPDQIQCEDQSCISGHLLCNGKQDCLDGIDESNCSNLLNNCDVSSQFECSKGSCIPLALLCNNKPDCIGWEDESEELCGINECNLNNGGCSQLCIDLPIGFKCDCGLGYKLVNNHTCNDINECLEPGICSQKCVNEHGSFKCSCSAGYLQDPRNETRCKAVEGHASLLFARRHGIRKISLDHREMTTLVNETKMAAALDFVFRTGMIFWSDVIERKIYKAPIDEGTDRTSVIDEDLTISDGLAVDWIYNHIYWTDVEKSNIQLSDFEGNMKKTILTDNMHEPRSIALNPLDGWMYWTDWSDQARIEKAGMDGSHRSVLVGNDIKWPNGLTLDLIGSRLYWVDAKLHIIGSCNYDGTNRRTVLYSIDSLKHPFSITMFEDYVYWSDWDKRSIFKANKFNGENIEAIISTSSLQHPMTVHVYHPYKQPDGINQCQNINGHCSHLCLPSPKINKKSPLISCACPDGLVLSLDGLSCVEKVAKISYINYKNIDEAIYPGSKYMTGMIGIILFVVFLLLALFTTLFFKPCIYNTEASMNFDNPVYKKTTEQKISFEKNKLLFQCNIRRKVITELLK